MQTPLAHRAFSALFWTQFSGALNDNLLKYAFILLLTWSQMPTWLTPTLAGAVISGVFILPFVVFSALSGQISDKLEKRRVALWVKNLEIGIMLCAAAGFVFGQVELLLLCTFGMGLHSTLFGPIKYALLPEILPESQLTAGNGWVEAGTFIAILLGTILGGWLITAPSLGPAWAAAACLAVAVLGRIAAHYLPHTPAQMPRLQLDFNPWRQTSINLKIAASHDASIMPTIIGISWLWFFGAVFLAQFPIFAKDVLHGTSAVTTLLLLLFCVGIGLGSVLCERFSHGHINPRLVPIGACGMLLFGADFVLASLSLPPWQIGQARWDPLTIAFWQQWQHLRIIADLLLLSLFSGLFSVPMYALIQHKSPASHRSRIIAAGNIISSLFMVVSSLMAMLLLGTLGWSLTAVFTVTLILHVLTCAWLFWRVPMYRQ